MDRIDELLVPLLERPPSEWPTEVEKICVAEAALAAEIRRRFAVLQRLGMTSSPVVAEEAPFPERFGPYRLLRRLGGGGMGVVYLARHEDLGRNVALKLMRPERLYFPEARERFRREVEAVARLEHPGCVQIHQVGETQGVPYFAMEHVAGVSLECAVQALAGHAPQKLSGHDLASVLRQSSAATVETASSEIFNGPWVRVCLRLALAVAEALAHAHARGVIHRDIKPANVMLTPEGRVVVIDFGLAVAEGTSRLTRSGAFLGSLPYMAPEQVRGDSKSVDARTDVYALGVCLYELLTLVSPFESASAETTRDQILAGKATPLRARNPAVSADVAVICATAMDLDPRRRYQTVADVAADLAAVLEHRTIAARPSGLVRRALRWARRHPATATAVTLSALALVCGPLIVSLAIAGQRDRAVDAERLARKREYGAKVAAANAALLAGNGFEARRQLDECPPELRGFEWRHLDLALDGALLTVQAHRAVATAVALSSDGSRLASGAVNGEIAVFDATTGARLHALAATTHGIRQLEFDVEGKHLYTLDDTGQLRVFDVGTGALLRQREPSLAFEALSLARQATVIVADRGGGRFARLDPLTFGVRDEPSLATDGELPVGFALTDGKRLCAPVGIGGVLLWDLDSGALLARSPKTPGATCMAMQPDFACVVGADPVGNLFSWSTKDNSVQRLDTGGRAVRDLAVTSDGHYLAAGCVGGELLVYRLADARLVRTLYGHRGEVRAVVAATARGLVATAGQDGTVRLWSVLQAPEVFEQRGMGPSKSACVSRAGVLFSGFDAGVVQRWDVATRDCVWQAGQPHWVNAMAMALDDTVVLTSFHSLVRINDAATGARLAEVALPPEAGRAYRMCVDATGRRLAVVTLAGRLALVDVVARQVVHVVEAHEGPVFGVAFDSSRGGAILTAGNDGRIVEFDANTLAQRRVLAAVEGAVSAILLDGDTLLTAERGALCRRDRTTGNIVQRQPCRSYLAAMQFVDAERLVTGADDGRVAFWDRQDLEPIVELRQPAQAIQNLVVHPHGDWVAVQCLEGESRILCAVSPSTGTLAGDLAVGLRQALLAAAREVAAHVFAQWPSAPAARRALAVWQDLDAELRATAERALPLESLWWVGASLSTLVASPESAIVRRPELERLRDLAQEGLRDYPEGAGLLTSIALALANYRLGEPQAALDALDGVESISPNHRSLLCLVRVWAHTRLGQHAEADAAYAELRALAEGERARDPLTLNCLREAQAALGR